MTYPVPAPQGLFAVPTPAAAPAAAACARRWGRSETLAEGTTFSVRRMVVDPGGRLSLQSHHHRSEHWIVVRGTATVTVGQYCHQLFENEGVFIPEGEIHRLENFGQTPLELIEVQYGTAFGEEDVVRYADEYGRADRA